MPTNTAQIHELPPLSTPAQVGEYLQVGRDTLRNWHEAGLLRAIEITPATWRYRRQDVEGLIAGHEERLDQRRTQQPFKTREEVNA